MVCNLTSVRLSSQKLRCSSEPCKLNLENLIVNLQNHVVCETACVSDSNLDQKPQVGEKNKLFRNSQQFGSCLGLKMSRTAKKSVSILLMHWGEGLCTIGSVKKSILMVVQKLPRYLQNCGSNTSLVVQTVYVHY